MTDFISLVNKYVRSELIVLLPVLYILGRFLISEKVDQEKVNIVLLTVSVVLSGLYLFSALEMQDWKDILFAIFTSFVQGIILTGGVLFGNSLFKNMYTKSESNDSVDENTTSKKSQSIDVNINLENCKSESNVNDTKNDAVNDTKNGV